MKMNRKLLLTFLLLSLVTVAGFCTNPAVKIKPLGNKSFALYITDLGNEKHSIVIKDSEGIILVSQKTRKQDAFAKRFNLNNLVDGAYYLEINDNQKTLTYPINLSDNKLAVLESAQVKYKPVVKQTGKSMDLMVFSPDKSSYELTIYNENYEIVHDELMSEQTNYQKKIDFSVAAPGSYSVVLNSQGHRYTYVMPVK
jgi:hypothetical protein